ncbi:serine hydrolase domain-containing protein [Dinghuibacter silviterrae]|uniref:CubicO group peptidase (Beta-lactamase class C family) n=1 Tax=Dinghuibacter silviterrae TaxID=1539049 RepID=A0A4R8DFD7_9BACT|nr:serine hydrolase domain-containing protein [Dinghuibacter silviterrae]TDW96313.1 CubicO group peptidase (beta-lactamase class C family) [Dinghuibacter silviterrae]
MLKYSLLLLSIIATVATAQVTPMDTIVQHAAADYAQKPWASLSIGVIKDGQVHTYNYGATGTTLYELGSITKTFTSLLLAQAVVDKKIKLTDDIRLYLKEKYPNLEYKGQPIQLIHLANLTSHLPNNIPDFTEAVKKVPPDSMYYAVIKINEGYGREDFLRDLHQVQLDTFPGLIPQHSNAAAQLMGFILENIYGDSYEHLVEKYILNPLQMTHTYVDIPADQAGLLAKCYNDNGTPMPYIALNSGPAAGIKSCIEDMTRYMAYQLEEKEAVVRLSHQVAWGNIQQLAVGLNWILNTNFDGQRKVSHDGTTFGFTSCSILYPERHFGVVIMANEMGHTSQGMLYGMADKIYNESFYTAAERASDGFGFSSSINLLLKGLQKRGFASAIDVARDLSKSHPGFALDDNELNNWAYSLLQKGKLKESLEIFKLNTSLHPDSWNDYDSEAEGYEDTGDTANAIKFYKRSLELNPNNTNAAEHLKKLQP